MREDRVLKKESAILHRLWDGDAEYVKDLEEDEVTALCDLLNDAVRTAKNGVVKLRWSKIRYRNRRANLLLITKVWVNPFGVRKVRIQCHRISEDGRIGPRQLLEERHQGRIVR